MDHLPFNRDGRESRAAFSPPSHCLFPQRTLYTVPEQETESCVGPQSARHSSHLSGLRGGPESQSLSMNTFLLSPTRSKAQEPAEWFPYEMQKLENHHARRRAYRWLMPVRLVLHIVNLAASIAIVTLLAQALISHQRLRFVRQFSGAGNAWPKNMSLAASLILLLAAIANVVKSVTFLIMEAHLRTRQHSNTFLVISTACSALMAAVWVPACVYVEINRQNNDDFATWACARSDAAFNQIVPYKKICNEEVSS